MSTPTPDPGPESQSDPYLHQLTGTVLAIYYRQYFRRSLQSLLRPGDFVLALAADLEARSLTVQKAPFANADLLVAEVVPVRVLKERWITPAHEDAMTSLLRRRSLPVGLILNFGSRTPTLRRIWKPP